MTTSKINFCKENIDGNERYKSTRKGGIGTRIISIALGISVAVGVTGLATQNDSLVDNAATSSYVVSAPVDDINGFNIIINDADCSNSFFSEITDILREDGLKFETAEGFKDINRDDAVVLSLDQQYSSGADTVIFAPYNNTRVGNSDSLALCMHSAFKQNGLSVEDIACGQVGFQKDENGNVNYTVPTATEKAIDNDKNTSFVTISLGTNIDDAKSVALSIENGLVRQYRYLQECDDNSDLIYRASTTDDLSVVAEYFGTTYKDLIETNKIKNESFGDSQTIVNPNVKNVDSFNEAKLFHLIVGNTKSY